MGRVAREAQIFGINFWIVSAAVGAATIALSLLAGELLDFYRVPNNRIPPEDILDRALAQSEAALVILTSGVYAPEAALAAIRDGAVTRSMTGAPLSAAAFATVYGPLGEVFVAVCLLLFAFTSLLGTSYYGERGLQYLTGSDRWRLPFRAAFLAAIAAGSVGDVAAVWQLADIFNGLMALPNLCALLALSPEALALLRRWTEARRGG